MRSGAASLLVEIGTEELPANVVAQALKDLDALGHQLLGECRLTYDHIRTVGTPRRLALLVDGVSARQTSLTQEIVGPPKSAAFDTEGIPTKAALGFAKSQGVSVEQLVTKETPKGLYLAAEKHQPGQAAKAVLTSNLPTYIAKLSFPKAMRWNSSQVRFARPVRWIVALLGSQLLKVQFAGICSGRMTRGHRFFRHTGMNMNKGVSLAHAQNYVRDLKKAGVIVDQKERREEITRQITALAKSARGQIEPGYREELLEEAVWGTENPHAILGTFEKDFLDLPKTVLMSSMKEHQGFFSLVRPDQTLLPKFLAVTNMPWGNTKLITKGNERVLAARLNDAQYFYTEDRKQPIHARLKALEGVMFHHQLGTMRQKADRLQALVGWFVKALSHDELYDQSRRAALLAKADLTTGMVGEFPTLQGTMGEEYARCASELPEVCHAIGEQYLPRFPDDQIPSSFLGAVLGCADRCDSIVSFFSVGLVPTGSEDPLGLRRGAYGLVRIVIETPLRLELVQLIERSIQISTEQGLPRPGDNIVQDILSFILDRVRFYGKYKMDFRDDVMDAVIRGCSATGCDLTDAWARMAAIHQVVEQPEFDSLMVAFKRAHRIVDKEQWGSCTVTAEHFQHASEEELSRALNEATCMVDENIELENYGLALKNLLTLKFPIDEFFNGVMVNDPEPKIRANRLSLLAAVDQLFLRVADFSRIQSVPAV